MATHKIYELSPHNGELQVETHYPAEVPLIFYKNVGEVQTKQSLVKLGP